MPAGFALAPAVVTRTAVRLQVPSSDDVNDWPALPAMRGTIVALGVASTWMQRRRQPRM